MADHTIAELLVEYDRALAYSDALWADLDADELVWRPHAQASAIGWHLGHQAAVAHFMVRNLTAAEPSPDPELDALMDSATPEPDRGVLPDAARLGAYRSAVADRVRFRVGRIDAGEVGAPRQLRIVATNLLVAVIDHEYQHATWIAEVRSGPLGRDLPPRPRSDRLVDVDGYLMLT
jgi:hypothetical protein